MCAYECSPLELFERRAKNPNCLTPVELEYERMGGAIPFFALMGIFLIISLSMFTLLSHRAKEI